MSPVVPQPSHSFRETGWTLENPRGLRLSLLPCPSSSFHVPPLRYTHPMSTHPRRLHSSIERATQRSPSVGRARAREDSLAPQDKRQRESDVRLPGEPRYWQRPSAVGANRFDDLHDGGGNCESGRRRTELTYEVFPELAFDRVRQFPAQTPPQVIHDRFACRRPTASDGLRSSAAAPRIRSRRSFR